MRTRNRLARARLHVESLEDRCTPAVAYALSGANLLSFDTANPTLTNTTAITGITAGETLVGIDFRPQNGLLYGLGVNATADTATLYAISTRTGVAAAVGTPSSIAFVTDPVWGMTAPVDLPDPAMQGYGVDFNPTVDRIRVVAGSLNFRVNPNTGLPIDGNLNITDPMMLPAGTNTDAPLTVMAVAATSDAAAYTNNAPNVTVTTQYVLDAATNQLRIQTPPNAGTQVNPLTVTLNGMALDFSDANGFDIAAGVNAPASGMPVASGAGFAVLTVGGSTGLYSINLVTGAAMLVGTVGNGMTPVSGLAVESDLGGTPAIGLNAAGTALVRFNTATPGTSTTATFPAAGMTGGIAMGETLVAIDFRPQTGQLYGLGINATANTGTLYLIDPQALGGVATATAVGPASQIALSDALGAPITLPAGGYGLDFNPTVDRIRVTTGTGLNFRINPNNGAVVDTNAMAAGNQPDGAINGLPMGSTGVSATAYTNSFGQSLTGGVTTQYTLDAASNMLFIQTPPNSGTQVTGKTVTLNGAPLDFTDVNGFDIPAGVRVTTSGTVASGFGTAVLTVGGTSNLYRINLSTGEATLNGAPLDFTDVNGFDISAGVRVTTSGTVASGFGTAVLTVGGNSILYRIDLSTGAATVLGAAPTGLNGLALADAPAGAIAFSGATFSASEGGTLNLTFTRTGGTTGSVSATVTATGGTATAGTDFTSGPFTVTFADGATTATVSVPLTSDRLVEGPETITLALSMPTNGAVLGAQAMATATINDVDVRPFGTIVSSPNSPNVTVLNPDGSVLGTFAPFGTVGARAAFGDITGDGVEDVMMTPASGGSTLLIFDGATAALIAQAPLFAPGNGSATVAAGDFTGDGRADILAGSSVGGRVRVFDGATGALLADVTPFAGFAGAFNVSAGDTNGDGIAELVLAASSGRVMIFDPVRGVLADGNPFGPFGAAVAMGDLDGDGRDDLIVASLGGAPTVGIIRGNGTVSVFNPALGGALSVAAVDVDNDGRDDIVLGSSTSGLVGSLAGDDLALLSVTDFGLPGIFVG